MPPKPPKKMTATTTAPYDPFGPVKNALGQVYRGTQSALQSLGPVGEFFTQPSHLSAYYQVKRRDRNIAEVAAKNGVSPEAMIAINKTKTLPPVGSYLQLNQGVPDVIANQIAGLGSSSTIRQEGRGDPAAQRLRSQAATITQQLMNGQLPASIPSAALGFIRDSSGMPLTIQDLIQEGYVMDAKGVLTLGGKGAGMMETPVGTGSAEFMSTKFMQYNAEKNVPFLKQLRWDPERKKYVQIGTLLKEGKLDIRTGKTKKSKKRRQQEAAVNKQAAVSTPAGEGPQTVLDIHLGSG